jgi:hypothetical protein
VVFGNIYAIIKVIENLTSIRVACVYKHLPLHVPIAHTCPYSVARSADRRVNKKAIRRKRSKGILIRQV